MRAPIKTVDAYIAAAPKPAQAMMKQIRSAIKSVAPKTNERISYAIPFYEYKSPGYKGRLAYYGAFKSHVSMFVVPEKVSASLAKQLKRYRVAKSTLRFPLGTKVPVTLIKRLIKLRMKEIDANLKKNA
jgi:uncharacterized protein YdhG (YjbR/CyaY superfamily)